MTGLWQQIEEWKRQRNESRAHAARPQTDPRIAHDDEVTAKELDRRIMQARERAIVNERAITEIEEIIGRLEGGEGSRDRSIAIRCLEDATMRLARENGPKC